jgi:hypothetical protein
MYPEREGRGVSPTARNFIARAASGTIARKEEEN